MPSKKKRMTPEEKKKFVNTALAIFAISIVFFAVVGAFVMDRFSNLQQIEDATPEYDDSYKGEIDDRLRFIDMQERGEMTISDEKSIAENEELKDDDDKSKSNEPEEIALFLQDEGVKKTKFEEYNEKHFKQTNDSTKDELKLDNVYNNSDDIPYRKEMPNTINPTLKVVIGSYSTKEAAQSALAQASSQFSAPPFIKFVDGKYVLQVASFKNKKTATEYVNSLKGQGYTARIIEE